MYFKKTPSLVIKLFPSICWDCKSDQRLKLSFDDGPYPDSTPIILAKLKALNIKASFFCLGKQVKKYPDLYQRIIEDGHLAGNHGHEHISGWSTNKSDYLENIMMASNYISSEYYRPPYGRMTTGQLAQVKKSYKVVMWGLMPGDFDKDVTKEKLVHSINTSLTKDSIVVLHDRPDTIEKVSYALDNCRF